MLGPATTAENGVLRRASKTSKLIVFVYEQIAHTRKKW